MRCLHCESVLAPEQTGTGEFCSEEHRALHARTTDLTATAELQYVFDPTPEDDFWAESDFEFAEEAPADRNGGLAPAVAWDAVQPRGSAGGTAIGVAPAKPRNFDVRVGLPHIGLGLVTRLGAAGGAAYGLPAADCACCAAPPVTVEETRSSRTPLLPSGARELLLQSGRFEADPAEPRECGLVEFGARALAPPPPGRPAPDLAALHAAAQAQVPHFQTALSEEEFRLRVAARQAPLAAPGPCEYALRACPAAVLVHQVSRWGLFMPESEARTALPELRRSGEPVAAQECRLLAARPPVRGLAEAAVPNKRGVEIPGLLVPKTQNALAQGGYPLDSLPFVPRDAKVSPPSTDVRAMAVPMRSCMLPESEATAAEVRSAEWPLPIPPGLALAPEWTGPLGSVEAVEMARAMQFPAMKVAVLSFSNPDRIIVERNQPAPMFEPARKFWAHAPSDLKLISLILPVLLMVVLVSTLSSQGQTTAVRKALVPPLASPKQPSNSLDRLRVVFSESWGRVQRNLMDRAGVEFADDFHSGLSSWQGTGDWAKTWGYDAAGSVRVGKLALFTPSMQLSDYTLEFLGQIEKKGIGWAVRAADTGNYQAVRIVHIKPGPLPVAALVRYRVVNGREGPRVQRPLPFQVRNDMLYRISMTAQGSDFTIVAQGQVVDAWSDASLSKGGIGFFSARGEQSLLRWVEVSHQYDALGRLCAYLAPYHMQTGGSWKQ